MSEWREESLGDLVTFASGGTPSKANPEYWDGDIPWISGASLTSTRLSTSDRNVTQAAIGNGTRIAPKESSLILVRGMSLHKEIRVGQAQRDLAFNQDVKALVAGPRLTSDYLLYALDGRRDELLSLVHAAGHGTGVLATDRLQRLAIALPPLDEQRRIAAVLGALDDLIETNRVLAVALETQARHLVAQSPDLVPLSSFAVPANTRQVRPAGRVEHYSLPAFDNGLTPERVDGAQIQSNKLEISQPSVLVSRLNPKWERCWLAYPGERAVASTEFVPLLGVDAQVEEVWSATSAPAYWQQMREHVTGTTGSHQRVDKAALLDLLVPDVRLLPSSVRDGVVALVLGARGTRDEIADLIRTRNELLPLLISGRVRVEDVEGAA